MPVTTVTPVYLDTPDVEVTGGDGRRVDMKQVKLTGPTPVFVSIDGFPVDAFYRRLLLSWLRRYSIQPQDAEELVQQALEVVVREMDHYDPKKGSIRCWLRGILVNRLRQFRRLDVPVQRR